MVTLNDIAVRLGISKSTVSKGLSNASDVSEELRKKIIETAAEMGYSGRRTQKRLCILVENMGYKEPNQFGYELISGFVQRAKLEGWTVDVVPLDKERQKDMTYSDFMTQGGYQGAFLLGFSLLDPWMEEFKTAQIPTVLYDNYIKENPFIASVGCDNDGGLKAAVKHLYGLGHRRIGLLSGPLDSYIVKERYNAYLGALEECGLPVDEDLIGLGYFVAESTRQNLPKLIEKGATAILCADDSRAVAAYTECHDRSLRIPGDVSIVGFDDLPIAAYMNPALTTVRQDRPALGKCGYYALQCLLSGMDIHSIVLRAPLVVRGSTGPAAVRPEKSAEEASHGGGK
ncbi:MAG: LacI family transcriptional regulator [Clostridiales bacterium]|nr:LacI family transcriptional regulator [Clostridiales bacterium]